MTNEEVVQEAIKRAKADAINQWPFLADKNRRRQLPSNEQFALQAFLQRRGYYWIRVLTPRIIKVSVIEKGKRIKLEPDVEFVFR